MPKPLKSGAITRARFEVFTVNTLRLGSKNLVREIDERLAHALQVMNNPHNESDKLRKEYKREPKRAVTPRTWGKMTACRMF